MSETPLSERLHGLDALRAGALLLGIFFHAGLSFFPGDTFWVIMDTQRSAVLSAFAFTSHMFRMTLFFVLAGFFGNMLLQRFGVAAFLADRLKRIGLPLLLFLPLMVPLFTALVLWGIAVSSGGALPGNLPPPPPLTVHTFPLTHLWFLYVLLLIYGAFLIARQLLRLPGRSNSLGRLSDAGLEIIGKTPFLPVLMALPTAIALFHHDPWYAYFGIPAPDHGLIPNLPAIVAYGTAFALGWALHRRSGLLVLVSKPWPAYLVVAAGLTIACLYVIGTSLQLDQFLSGRNRALYAIGYSVGTWCWTFGLIGLSLRFCAGENGIRRYVADASYWMYIIHLPIVTALQILVSRWLLPAELKYLLILAVSIPLMLASYHVMVRFSVIGALLNGRKHQKPVNETRMEAI